MIIDIIGGGIGGLTTALALEQKGFKVRIFEQAEEIKPVGAGIIMANNAMQVYQKLGLREQIEKNGNHISSMNITKADLNPISKVDLSYFEKKHHVKNIAIHRGKLQQILVNSLKTSELHLNHHLSNLKQGDNGTLLTFENGHEVKSSILIGADGIGSVVRKQLFPETVIRDAGQICWRGITDFKLPLKYKNELNEAWGRSDRFGFVQIAKDKVYWYALKSFKTNKNEFSGEAIEANFKHYDQIVGELITSTNKNQINTAEISDLKPIFSWYKDNICLLGDAAHATTPNMGQGACQAIEDADVLAQCLEKYKVDDAFKAFQKLRLPKAHQVVKGSWLIGKLAHVNNPVLRRVRNQVMRMTPEVVSRRQSEQIFQISQV